MLNHKMAPIVEGFWKKREEMSKSERMTEQDLQAILARQQEPIPDDPYQATDEPESVLSKRIRSCCKTNGYPALILPQNKLLRYFIPEGWLDGVIALPNSRVIFLELNAKKGELRKAQKLMTAMLLTLGHEVYQVKTWKRFLEIVYQ